MTVAHEAATAVAAVQDDGGWKERKKERKLI